MTFGDTNVERKRCKPTYSVDLNSLGRKQVCSQRWARLEISLFPIFPRRKFPFWYTFRTNFSSFKKWQANKQTNKPKQNKKGHLLIFVPFPFHFKFSSSPSFTSSLLFLSIFTFSLPLFSLSSSFSSPFLFSSFSPSFEFSLDIPRVGTRPPRPPLVTPLLPNHVKLLTSYVQNLRSTFLSPKVSDVHAGVSIPSIWYFYPDSVMIVNNFNSFTSEHMNRMYPIIPCPCWRLVLI